MKRILILLCLPFMTLAQQTYVPDDNFEAYLEANGMGNNILNDSNVFTSAIDTVTNLSVTSQNIADLTGIQDFTALTSLYCYSNQLTSLDVSNNPNLIYLICRGNQLTSLDVSQNTALISFACGDNQLSILDVSQNTALTSLICDVNQLTILDVSGATALTGLDCSSNQLTSLDVSGATALTHLFCSSNQLTSLDVSGATSLTDLRCQGNQLGTLDVSQNTALTDLRCLDNQLTCLDVSNNTTLIQLECENNLLEQLNTRNGNWVNGMTILAETNNLTCVEVDNLGYANTNWINTFDSFVSFSTNCNYANPCNTTSAIQEQTTNKELLRTIDILGRETKNQPLFYIYDDGTVEKRITIE